MSSLDPHQAAVADSFDSSILHVLADVSSRDVGGPPQASSSSSSANKATGTRPAAKAHEAQPPAKRKRSKKVDDDDEMPPEPEKKSKACHACRRVKLRCITDPEGGPCRRCAARNEECVITTPLHDLKWQQSMENRVEHLSNSLDYLIGIMRTVADHLTIPFDPPRETGPKAPIVSAVGPTPPAIASPPKSAAIAPQPRAEVILRQPATSRELTPARRNPPEHNYLTQSGAEELLMQAYARFETPFSVASEDAGIVAPVTVPTSNPTQTRPQLTSQPSVFDLLSGLDDQSSPESMRSTINGTGESSNKTMAARLLGSSNPEAVGASDPRSDVVKAGVVTSGDAEVLLDFFHAHLAPHFCGFVMRLRAWPYLPAGKSTITPLILGAICLVAAERIPRYHHLLARLEASDLKDSVLNATPGLSFAPGSDAAQNNGLEPDLDLELGIGPEEICSLLTYASFSTSPRSDTIARTAFEWTRGYLKTFMLPSPPPVTYGEVFGLLPARRDLTFENWLRLWLFGYVVDVQQSLHQESLAPVFDPHYFCETLLLQSLNSPNLIDQQHDRELVAHARLCAILQRVQYTRATPGWSASSAAELVASADAWNADLERWWTEQDLNLSACDIALKMFRLFGQLFVNLAASTELRLRSDAARWKFKSTSAAVAWDMLLLVKDEPNSGMINMLFPFFVKMILLASVVLLDSFQDIMFICAPCTLALATSAVEQIASNLSRAPVPKGHPFLAASISLRKAVDRTTRWAARAGFLANNTARPPSPACSPKPR